MRAKQTLNIVSKVKLTIEAKKYLNFWKMEEEDLIFFKSKTCIDNWIKAYSKKKRYFLSLSTEEGCKSAVFGNLKHVKSMFIINEELLK